MPLSPPKWITTRCSTWVCTLKSVYKLQLVQSAVAQAATNLPSCAHVTLLLRKLPWLPVCLWAQFTVLLAIDKALCEIGPGYLCKCLFPLVSTHPVRSAEEAGCNPVSKRLSACEVQKLGPFSCCPCPVERCSPGNWVGIDPTYRLEGIVMFPDTRLGVSVRACDVVWCLDLFGLLAAACVVRYVLYCFYPL